MPSLANNTASGIQLNHLDWTTQGPGLFETIRGAYSLMKEIQEEALDSVRQLRELISTDTFDQELQTIKILQIKNEEPAIIFKPHCVIVCSKKMYLRMNAVHLLVIRALVEKQDKFGICTDEQIESFLRQNGLEAREGRQQAERIRSGIKDGVRFLGIPLNQVGNNGVFAERIRGKGYRVWSMIKK